ncbi:TIGR02453 family protein [candidate division WOR-3 bacterium]|uniref:TIGR02453 family protein n=1 Tax=candidate division WOR-3 bacterium TaxID=2052148 RepID=A0A9D5K8I4_UNCW3|nr:TIGR02453 family protein [candidate division WOR-3 bacterium]MBD3364291.1 TIGR02453 family protein [candidate division WOR-3 bacterium]
MNTTDKFKGFPEKGLKFLKNLAANNNKEWFEDNKEVYRQQLVAPSLSFITEFGQLLQKKLSPDIVFDTRTNGAGSLFRIYRDVRFSKDKSPYKTHLGVLFWEGEGKKMANPGYYFHLEPGGAVIYAGQYIFDKQTLQKYRSAVADEERGSELEKAIQKVKKAGYEISGQHYKRVPRGFAPDHPREELLRYNGLYAQSPAIKVAELTSPQLIKACLEHCKNMAPIQEWLVNLKQESVR